MSEYKKRQLDWMIVPHTGVAGTVIPQEQHTYDFFNITTQEALCDGERKWGINLVWCDPATSDNVRFARQSGAGEPLKFEELVAINIRNGKWLKYYVRDTGIRLGWSDQPVFEWKIMGGTPGTEVVSGNQVGLYNMVENDFLIYDVRDWGINLKWWKDIGKFNDGIGGLIKTGIGEAIKWGGKELGARFGGAAGAELMGKAVSTIL